MDLRLNWQIEPSSDLIEINAPLKSFEQTFLTRLEDLWHLQLPEAKLLGNAIDRLDEYSIYIAIKITNCICN
jgi:hypothetical protein